MRINPSAPIPVSRLQIAAVWAVVMEFSSWGSKMRTKSFSVPWPYVAIIVVSLSIQVCAGAHFVSERSR